jgi:uncharacterized protein
MPRESYRKLIKFIWDKGNKDKNWKKHKATNKESEEVFFDNKKKAFKDHLHFGKEERFRIIGKSKKNRLLFIVFTVRNEKIRIISARDINKKEVYLYEKTT